MLPRYFPPEIGAEATLFYELAEGLQKRGNSVKVITNFPWYNLKEIPAKYRKKYFLKEKTGNIDIDSDVIKDKLILTISDSGHGISQDNLQKIFDPFFSTKDAGKGTGLGLSITYNIIQEHNGSISYKSKENFGTIVTIELPIIKI